MHWGNLDLLRQSAADMEEREDAARAVNLTWKLKGIPKMGWRRMGYYYAKTLSMKKFKLFNQFLEEYMDMSM